MILSVGRCIPIVLIALFAHGVTAAEKIEKPLDLGPRAIAGILQSCDRVKASHKENQKFEIKSDHLGRPGTIVASNGLEYVIQYSSDKEKIPSGIVGNGLNAVANGAIVPRAEIEKHLANRVRMYRLVKSICSMDTHSAGGGMTASLAAVPGRSGRAGDEDLPGEYYDSGFWAGAWEPTYDDYSINASQNYWAAYDSRAAEIAARRAECMGTCNNACDIASDFVGVTGCGAVGLGLMASGVGAIPGAAVVLACGTGAITGKYWCKFRTCPANCGG